MISLLADQIKKFYLSHESLLQSLHPGLNLHTLTREIEWFDTLQNNKLNPKEIFDELLSGKPLAFILGHQFFYDSFFKVNDSTLIPRLETELIIERSLELIKKNNLKDIADIGCGSGIIGLTLAKNADLNSVMLTDISKGAIELSKENAYLHQYQLPKTVTIDFHLGDRLDGISKPFDFIVSNPPYIKKQADQALVHPQVLSYEPSSALFLEDAEYNQWFKLFFEQVLKHLTPGGYFLMEGHEAHLDELAALMGSLNGFSDINIINDLTDRSRFIESRKNG